MQPNQRSRIVPILLLLLFVNLHSFDVEAFDNADVSSIGSYQYHDLGFSIHNALMNFKNLKSRSAESRKNYFSFAQKYGNPDNESSSQDDDLTDAIIRGLHRVSQTAKASIQTRLQANRLTKPDNIDQCLLDLIFLFDAMKLGTHNASEFLRNQWAYQGKSRTINDDRLIIID